MADVTSPPERAPDPGATSWSLIAVSCVLAALVIDFGRMHVQQDADSLLPVLVSIQRWTPFFWGQDRYGMLVPLLASPIGDPMANLLLQHGLGASAALATFFLLAAYARAPHVAACGALSAATFLLACPAPLRFQFLVVQPYGVSFALGLAGLLCWDTRVRLRIVGIVLVLLAHWVNAGTWLLLGPLAIARAALTRAPARPLGDLGVIAAGALVGNALMAIAPHHPTDLGVLPVATWPAAWHRLAAHVGIDAGSWPLASALVGVAGCVVLLLRRDRRAAGAETLRAAGALASASLAYAFAVGIAAWVAINAANARYLLPTMVLLAVALAAPAAAALGSVRRTTLGRLAVPVILVGAGLAAYGAPSLAGVRAALARIGDPEEWTQRIVAADCTHVAGSYWHVWPVVFYGTALRRERGSRTPLWGVTDRSADTRGGWRTVPRAGFRICVAPGDDAAAAWLRRFGFDELVSVSTSPHLDVLSPGPRAVVR